MDFSLDIAVTTVPRLLLFGAFLYKTKSALPYYYIWLPALVSFAHSGIYFVTAPIPFDTELHCALVILIWFAIGTYWIKLDKRNIPYRNISIYYFIVVPICAIIMGLFTWYIDQKTTPYQYKFLSTALSTYTSWTAFVGVIRDRPNEVSVSSSASFHAFACIASLQPAQSILNAFIATYGVSWPHAEKSLSVAQWIVYLIEGAPLAGILLVLRNGYAWPPFVKKHIGDSEGIPNYRSIS